ncbi:MAG: site-specific integrase [Bacteroidales bacterium]|nr:site-specific integrase [Bacteroidales bacterium]MDD4582169.1 site-specific integrase [Bacteroidales bacterium]
MNISINIVCYRHKILANGENPLMIRVSKNGKTKYKSIGISILPQYWDFIQNKPKRNCPNKEMIQKIINETLSEYNEKALALIASKKEFTVNDVIANNPITTNTTVEELFDFHIKQLILEDRLKYASTFKELKKSLLDYNKRLNISFMDINMNWLKDYETWLRQKNYGENSIGIRFRTFRVLYNIAIEKGIVKSEHYPFKTYKVAKLHMETIKRAISKQDIKKIIDYKTKDVYTQLSIDIFLFSYFCGGINFKDIAYLTRENVIDNKLVYFRKKTKKLIRLPLNDNAMKIINKYDVPNCLYLFPIFNDKHITELQKANRLHKVLSIVNARLKRIGKELNLPIKLTTYVARHSFATVLKKAGVSTAIISESLGHTSEKTTQIYLDSFDNEQIAGAMENLL